MSAAACYCEHCRAMRRAERAEVARLSVTGRVPLGVTLGTTTTADGCDVYLHCDEGDASTVAVTLRAMADDIDRMLAGRVTP